jgi:O-antigen ligase
MLFLDRSQSTWKQFAWLGSGSLMIITVFLVSGVLFSSGFLGRLASSIGGQIESILEVVTEGPTADPSMRARWNAWEIALDSFWKHPIIGTGPGSRPLGFFDSHWFRELVETGLAGFLCFCWIQLSAFRLCAEEAQKDDSPVQALALGFASAQVGLWVHAFSASNFYTIRTTEPFFFMLGLVVVGYLAHHPRSQVEISSSTETNQEMGPH